MSGWGRPEPGRGVPDAGQRRAQVALDVDGERLERGDVEHPAAPLGVRPAVGSAASRSSDHRNAASVLPEPVGATTRALRPARSPPTRRPGPASARRRPRRTTPGWRGEPVSAAVVGSRSTGRRAARAPGCHLAILTPTTDSPRVRTGWRPLGSWDGRPGRRSRILVGCGSRSSGDGWTRRWGRGRRTPSAATDRVIGTLGDRTVREALAAGVPANDVWRAVHVTLDLPAPTRADRTTGRVVGDVRTHVRYRTQCREQRRPQ